MGMNIEVVLGLMGWAFTRFISSDLVSSCMHSVAGAMK